MNDDTVINVAIGRETAAQTTKYVRLFETGATRSADAGRYDPEGFVSPIALERYCEYMHKHRFQADGSVRDSDNWQKGMPLASYAKGLWRHFLHFWQRHRGWTVTDPGAATDVEEDLCAMWFNIQGYLHELVKARRAAPLPVVSLPPSWTGTEWTPSRGQ